MYLFSHLFLRIDEDSIREIDVSPGSNFSFTVVVVVVAGTSNLIELLLVVFDFLLLVKTFFEGNCSSPGYLRLEKEKW